LEFIATENLNGNFPTSKDIADHFSEYHKDYLKKAITALRKNDLVLVEDSIGRFDKLGLTNILREKKPDNQIKKKELTTDILEFQIRVLHEFVKIKAPLLHHIKILFQLREKGDYFSIG
jgi:hypothetical protein